MDYVKKMLLEPVKGRDDISDHFANVAQHRYYVRAAYELWELSAPELAPAEEPLKSQVEARVKVHDLSKYLPEEILGYSPHYTSAVRFFQAVRCGRAW